MPTTIDNYNACHELMLDLPNYTPAENEGVTYMIIQIRNEPGQVAIHANLVNPIIPEEGNKETLMKLPVDAQIGVIGLQKVPSLLREIHEKLQATESETRNKVIQRKLLETIHNLFEEKEQ